MRLTSEFWVSALVRRVFHEGGYAAIERKGAAEAGSIFVKSRSRDGLSDLYGPAPQTVYDTEKPQERAFILLLEKSDDQVLDAKLEREAKFDSDLWIVDLELNSPSINQLLEIRML